MQAGIQYEGEDDEDPSSQPSIDDYLAVRAWNLLATGMGSFDWAGLPAVCELLGIADVELLIHRLQVIKHHKPNAQDDTTLED